MLIIREAANLQPALFLFLILRFKAKHLFVLVILQQVYFGFTVTTCVEILAWLFTNINKLKATEREWWGRSVLVWSISFCLFWVGCTTSVFSIQKDGTSVQILNVVRFKARRPFWGACKGHCMPEMFLRPLRSVTDMWKSGCLHPLPLHLAFHIYAGVVGKGFTRL